MKMEPKTVREHIVSLVMFNQQLANLFPGDTLSQLIANRRTGTKIT